MTNMLVKGTKKFYPLPYPLKFIGIILLSIGIVLALVRFYYGIKLNLFNIKVFSIYSLYLEKKSFQIMDNNFGEEVPGILLLFGLIFIAFTKEKLENKRIFYIRFYAIIIAVVINSIFLLTAFLCFYGVGFLKILIINIYSPFIFYLIVFNILLFQYKWTQKIR